MASSFFSPGSVTQLGHIASLHLSRDSSLPVILSATASNADEEGYAEGVVTNTKFGSFPHKTLLDIPWGSQVRARKVDTGSRGRKVGNKRKADAISTDSPFTDGSSPVVKEAPVATSGFIHVLPPTPENWTSSLPHRTQVVYTPDYSYILHRIRARPGSVLLEAGSGSGSFTHAAARAVFGGTPSQGSSTESESVPRTTSNGRVYTFEYHAERHQKVLEEMEAHRLRGIVHAAHRDVYKEGFLIHDPASTQQISPRANAIFLDLPAPWEALPHLARASRKSADGVVIPSALDPENPVYICTFSPCIEQVQRTISKLRRLGWLEIEMVEIQHRRLDVRREFVGLKYEGMRGVCSVPETVDEAIVKLKEDDERAAASHAGRALPVTESSKRKQESQLNNGVQQDAGKTIFNEGKIVHRSENEIKTHTSYLVFAILPREWTDEDELAAQDLLRDSVDQVPVAPKSQRQLKKEAKMRKKARLAKQTETEHEVAAQ